MEISKKYKFVENKDAKWQGIGLTKEVAGFTKVWFIGMEKLHPLKRMINYDYNLNDQILDSNG